MMFADTNSKSKHVVQRTCARRVSGAPRGTLDGVPRTSRATQSQLERALFQVLRNERNRQGMSLRALSALAGISHGQLSDLENAVGNKAATFTEMARLAEALGVDLGRAIQQIESGSLPDRYPEGTGDLE